VGAIEYTDSSYYNTAVGRGASSRKEGNTILLLLLCSRGEGLVHQLLTITPIGALILVPLRVENQS